MPKCANCPADAEFTYNVNGDLLIHYCETHLPKFLSGRKAAGELSLVIVGLVEPVVEEPVVEEPVKTSKKKATEPVVEETPVEEPAEEPAAE